MGNDRPEKNTSPENGRRNGVPRSLSFVIHVNEMHGIEVNGSTVNGFKFGNEKIFCDGGLARIGVNDRFVKYRTSKREPFLYGFYRSKHGETLVYTVCRTGRSLEDRIQINQMQMMSSSRDAGNSEKGKPGMLCQSTDDIFRSIPV